MKPRHLIVMGLPVICLAGLWWYGEADQGPGAGPNRNQAADIAPVEAVDNEQVVVDEPSIQKSRSAGDRRADVGRPQAIGQPGRAPALMSERFPADAYSQQRMEIFGEFWRRAETEWTADNYRAALQRKDALSGEEAYQVYVYIRTCLDAPRTESQAMSYFERAEAALARNPRMADSSRFSRWLDGIENGLARCIGLEDMELEVTALEWLTRAASRGYPLAQIAFYRSYRWLMARRPGLITRDAGRIDYYRAMAPKFLSAALDSGHGEALAEMGQALHDGIVYDRDPEGAYAYALAALDAGIDDLEVAVGLTRILEGELTPSMRMDARRRADELCATHCL